VQSNGMDVSGTAEQETWVQDPPIGPALLRDVASRARSVAFMDVMEAGEMFQQRGGRYCMKCCCKMVQRHRLMNHLMATCRSEWCLQ
jgi:hypothetical protein